MNVFFREIKANRRSIIFWSIGMFALVAMSMAKFGTLDLSNPTYKQLFDSMPKIIMVLFGMNGLDISTPTGYYGVIYAFIVIMAAIHATMLGATIISKEERDKTSEFLMTKPITREKVITNKLLAAFCNVVILNIATIFSSFVMMNAYAKGLYNNNDILKLMFGLFMIQLVFLAIGAGVAATTKHPKTAAGLATSVLLFTFFIAKAIDLSTNLDALQYITPFKYFDAANVLNAGIGIQPVFVVLSIVLVAVFVSMTYVFYKKRDLNI